MTRLQGNNLVLVHGMPTKLILLLPISNIQYLESCSLEIIDDEPPRQQSCTGTWDLVIINVLPDRHSQNVNAVLES
jgi:hypothetical protein